MVWICCKHTWCDFKVISRISRWLWKHHRKPNLGCKGKKIVFSFSTAILQSSDVHQLVLRVSTYKSTELKLKSAWPNTYKRKSYILSNSFRSIIVQHAWLARSETKRMIWSSERKYLAFVSQLDRISVKIVLQWCLVPKLVRMSQLYLVALLYISSPRVSSDIFSALAALACFPKKGTAAVLYVSRTGHVDIGWHLYRPPVILACSHPAKNATICVPIDSNNEQQEHKATQTHRTTYSRIYSTVPSDHLLLDSAPNLGPLISRWEINNKFDNADTKVSGF